MQHLEDIGVKLVKLSPGKYLIDDNVVEVVKYREGNVEVKDEKNIRKITETNIIRHYIDAEENKLPVEDYEDKKHELQTKGNYDEYDGFTFPDLDDEYNYKKFIRRWTPVRKYIQEISEPYKVCVIKGNAKSEYHFITSAFSHYGSEDISLFEYDRHTAWLHIVHNKFKELGMTYQQGISYGATAGKKVWGNSKHSCIEYVTAFGSYLFTRGKFTRPTYPKGLYEDMVALYKEDKKEIEGVIQTKYNLHFGKGNIDPEYLYRSLEGIKKAAWGLDIKKKAWGDRKVLVDSIQKVLDKISAGMVDND